MEKAKKSKIGVIGLKGLPAYGGAATVGENIVAHLADDFDFTIYSVSSHTHLKTGYYRNCFQIVIRKLPLGRVNSLLYYIRSALDALLFRKYDLIHLHHRDASFVIPLLKLRYPIVVTTHGMGVIPKMKKYKFFFDFEDRFFLHKANFITTVSRKGQRIVRKLTSHDKVKHIPNGINTNLGIVVEKQDYISFAAGRIIYCKGCHTFIEALGILERKEQAIIVGDLTKISDYRKLLLKEASKVGGVRFTGLIKDKKKLFEIIYGSKFFVFPSEMEAMSMMLLEVAALKVPIICSDIPENKDVFSEKEVLFFKVKDSQDLAAKINYATAHPEKMNILAENAYKKLQESYLWSQIAKEYKSVFEKFL